jgi:hypothetical protein
VRHRSKAGQVAGLRAGCLAIGNAREQLAPKINAGWAVALDVRVPAILAMAAHDPRQPL